MSVISAHWKTSPFSDQMKYVATIFLSLCALYIVLAAYLLFAQPTPLPAITCKQQITYFVPYKPRAIIIPPSYYFIFAGTEMSWGRTNQTLNWQY